MIPELENPIFLIGLVVVGLLFVIGGISHKLRDRKLRREASQNVL